MTFITKSIRLLGSNLVNFVLLRTFETTCKTLDSRVFAPKKANDRIQHGINSWGRIKKLQSTHILEWGFRLEGAKHTFILAAPKFEDGLERKCTLETINIYQVSSNEYIEIGNFVAESKEMILAEFGIPIKFQNRINGRLLSELSDVSSKKYLDRIIVHQVRV